MHAKKYLAAVLIGLLLAHSSETLAGEVLLELPGDSAGSYAPADEQGRYRYLVDFDATGALARYRSLRGTTESFHVDQPIVQSILAELRNRQNTVLAGIALDLGRGVEPTHRYLASRSGVALWLTPKEAEAVRARPEVLSLERERVFELDTYRGPEFIGARAIWDGSAVPGETPLTGTDQVVAILDSGLADPAEHDAFANDEDCGHGGGNPDKVLSILDCAGTDEAGMCNGPNPLDNNGHGSHVAATAAGNRITETDAFPALDVPGDFDEISGVAHCARIRSYKVCPGRFCLGTHILAGFESVLLHGDVDVANFSISGGGSPWEDNDQLKLDLVDQNVLVAASAGNDGSAGSVAHRGPWVLTVAASTRDVDAQGNPADGDVLAGFSSRGPTPAPLENIQKPDITAPGQAIFAVAMDFFVSATGPGLPPAATQDITPIPGSDTRVSTPEFSNRSITYDPDQPAGSDGCSGFPAGFFDGAVALVERGGCSFTDKINNAHDAGADFILVYNDEPGLLVMNTADQDAGIEAFFISQEAGTALRGFIGDSGGVAEIDYDIVPDYGFKSGTSMSSPHVAGAATLVRAARPDWSAMEVHSAVRMTAVRSGFKLDGETPWDADDVGSGRVDLTEAALAGLVMDETTNNFQNADPDAGGDVRTLNLPAVRDMNCEIECSFERTVRNTLDEATSWMVSGQGNDGAYDVAVSPSSFNFSGGLGETQTLTVTVTPQADLSDAVAFGEIVFTEADDKSPDLHWTAAVRGTNELPPELTYTPTSFDFTLEAGQSAQQVLTIGNNAEGPGAANLNFSLNEAPGIQAVVLEAGNTASAPQEPISLAVDNGSIGFIYSPDSVESVVWFNQFTPNPLDLPFVLDNAQIPFFISEESGVVEGDEFDVYVWSAPDGDPATEMNLLGSQTGWTVQVSGFHLLPFDQEIEITAETGDVLVGVAFRHSDRLPIGTDTGPSVGRSWVAHDFPGGEPGDPPDFSQAGTFELAVPDFNFLVRANGTGGSPCLAPEDVEWLAVAPGAGEVEPQQSEEVTVTVDSNGLVTGTHEALLCLSSDDPEQPESVIAVTMDVTAPPEPLLHVEPDSLAVTVVIDGQHNRELSVTNLGQATLDWTLDEPAAGCALPGWIAVQPVSGSLEQDASEPVTVSFNADGLAEGAYQADLCLQPEGDPSSAETVPILLDVVQIDIFQDRFESAQ